MSYMLAVTLIGTEGGYQGPSLVQHTRLLPLSEHSMFVRAMMTYDSNPPSDDLDLTSETPFTF